MNRKYFLSSLLPLSVPWNRLAKIPLGGWEDRVSQGAGPSAPMPPYLTKGDTIGITCPSGTLSFSETLPAIRKLQEWGFKVATGTTVGTRDNTFAGSDEQRALDLQVMLDNPSINAILLGRGGYGAVRIIDRLDFTKFRAHPKWIIGFSDATVFHSDINRRFGIPTLHSKMCNSFPEDWDRAEPLQKAAIESIRDCLLGTRMHYEALHCKSNRTGSAAGVLVGGNLSILESIAASRSQLKTAGKILFIEDTEEYLYNIDRMLWNLKRSGMLDNLKGLIVGGFTHVRPDDPGEEFGMSIPDIVLEKVRGLHFPVCFDFPVGHQIVNYALKCGVPHQLDVSETGVRLREI